MDKENVNKAGPQESVIKIVLVKVGKMFFNSMTVLSQFFNS